MRVHRVCIAVVVALSLDSRAALPQAAMEADTDSIGGRVTGSPESRAAADLLVRTLREAGFEDAHFEEYAVESRWQRGRAVGRVVSPVARPLGDAHA